MKMSILVVIMALITQCKTTNPNMSELDSGAAPNPRQGSVGGKAYPENGAKDEKSLAVNLAMIVRSLIEKESPDLKCLKIPPETPNLGTDCTIADPVTQMDSIHCYQLYFRELKDAPKAEREAETRAECTLVSLDWPKITPHISNILGNELSAIHGAQSSFTIGLTAKKLNCEKQAQWQCEWVGFGEVERFEIPFQMPKNLPMPVVEEGAKDDFGNLLPKSSREVKIKIGNEEVFPATYRASDQVLDEYLNRMPKKMRSELEQSLKDQDGFADIPKNCRKGELIAILDYTAEGYKKINADFRVLKNGKLNGTTDLSAFDAARLKTMTSAINCAKQARRRVSARGASLKPDRLVKYEVEGKTVMEHALTSTTMGTEVIPEFRGTTTFYILNAQGADLSNFSSISPETSAEGELLIRPGTLFKVGKVEYGMGVFDGKEQKTATIYLLQIP